VTFHHPGRRNETSWRANSTRGNSRETRPSAKRVCARNAARLPIRNFIGSASTALLGTKSPRSGDRYGIRISVMGSLPLCPRGPRRKQTERRRACARRRKFTDRRGRTETMGPRHVAIVRFERQQSVRRRPRARRRGDCPTGLSEARRPSASASAKSSNRDRAISRRRAGGIR